MAEVIKEISLSETVTYTLDGKYHRVDGPAIQYKNGDGEWWLHGRRHRIDGPAITDPQNTINKTADCLIATKSTPSIPVGSIINSKSVEPSGTLKDWLICDGSAISKNLYKDLYDTIGTNYGSNSNTFNIPDLSSRFKQVDKWYIHGVPYTEEKYWIKIALMKAQNKL